MNIEHNTNPRMGPNRILRLIIAGILAFIGGFSNISLSNWSRLLAPIIFMVLVCACGYLAAGGIGIDKKTRMGNFGVGNAWAASVWLLGLMISFSTSTKAGFTTAIFWCGMAPFIAYFIAVSIWLWRTLHTEGMATENQK